MLNYVVKLVILFMVIFVDNMPNIIIKCSCQGYDLTVDLNMFSSKHKLSVGENLHKTPTSDCDEERAVVKYPRLIHGFIGDLMDAFGEFSLYCGGFAVRWNCLEYTSVNRAKWLPISMISKLNMLQMHRSSCPRYGQ